MADVGGTKLRLAASNDLTTFLGEPLVERTPSLYDEGIALIERNARTLAGNEPIEGIALGMRGVLAPNHRELQRDSVLSDWAKRPLANDLESRLVTRAYLENDAAMVGLGEAVFGAGSGASIVAYITISTGIGGARITDGAIDRVSVGFEPGGQYVHIDGEARTFEELVSGRSVAARFGVESPKDIDPESPVWDELARITAFCVHTTILHWSPDRVVFGGSMFNPIGIKVERVHFYTQEILQKFSTLPDFAHSSLGDFGGLWGGMARLRKARQ